MISVIIPVADDWKRLSLTLSSLLAQSMDKRSWEVCLVPKDVDSGLDPLLSVFTPLLSIRCSKRHGKTRAEARNLGVEMSRGEVLVFVDCDLIQTPCFLQEHCKHHESGNSRVVVGEVRRLYFSKVEKVFGELIRNPSQYDWLLDRLPAFHVKSRPDPYFSLTRIPFKNGKNPIPWISMGTNNVSMRRSDFEALGGFDTEFQGWGYDNMELALRLYKKGVEFVYEPRAMNYHLMHPIDHKKRLQDIERNFNIFKKKHPSRELEAYWRFIQGELSIEELAWQTSQTSLPISSEKHFYREYQSLLHWLHQSHAHVS